MGVACKKLATGGSNLNIQQTSQTINQMLEEQKKSLSEYTGEWEEDMHSPTTESKNKS